MVITSLGKSRDDPANAATPVQWDQMAYAASTYATRDHERFCLQGEERRCVLLYEQSLCAKRTDHHVDARTGFHQSLLVREDHPVRPTFLNRRTLA